MRKQVSKTEGLNLRIVLLDEGTEAMSADLRVETMTALLEAGFEVSRSSAAPPPESNGSPMLVFGATSAEAADTADIHYHDMTNQSPEALVEKACAVRDAAGARELAQWKPWFPVIDYDRCTNCMQCLSFCLFDVYAVDKGGKITVQNESNCKTDCPACSRVCPEVAILFPKYRKGPINGDEVRAEDIQREAMKVDVSALLGGDIYASLRSRQSDARKRFSTERDESKALLERKRCLKKLKKDLDIPEEVLMSLPSAGDIEERAERAREKMKRRQERSRSAQDARRAAPTEDDWGI